MYPLDLPAPGPVLPLPFANRVEAVDWLARQPLAQAQAMLAVFQNALAALDASALPAAERLEILDLLRPAVIQCQTAVQMRYTRKALPLADPEQELFLASRKLWRTQAIAYLRTVGDTASSPAVLPLHRAAVSLRLEQHAHFLAAWEVPDELLHLCYGVLATAHAQGLDLAPLADPEFKRLGDSHVAGQIAWTFLLQWVDPYRLSPAQLVVANRVFSRWRELAVFQARPDVSPRGRTLPLVALLDPATAVAEGLAWLDVRPVARKLRKRIEALEQGESPEALKLGRELSAAACIQLLAQLGDALQPRAAVADGQPAEIRLVFEPDNIHLLLTGKPLASRPGTPPRQAVDHQRLAVFGFDPRTAVPQDKSRPEVPGETWCEEGGFLVREAAAGRRLLTPCLVARDGGQGQVSRPGVLGALRITANGRLKGLVRWYPDSSQAASARLTRADGTVAPLPILILGGSEGERSVVVPANAPIRPGERLQPEDNVHPPIVLGEALERGADFVRYAIAAA